MQKLPEDLRREVFKLYRLSAKQISKKETVKKKFKFDWEGGLSEIREKFTSVELQHKALEWK